MTLTTWFEAVGGVVTPAVREVLASMQRATRPADEAVLGLLKVQIERGVPIGVSGSDERVTRGPALLSTALRDEAGDAALAGDRRIVVSKTVAIQAAPEAVWDLIVAPGSMGLDPDAHEIAAYAVPGPDPVSARSRSR